MAGVLVNVPSLLPARHLPLVRRPLTWLPCLNEQNGPSLNMFLPIVVPSTCINADRQRRSARGDTLPGPLGDPAPWQPRLTKLTKLRIKFPLTPVTSNCGSRRRRKHVPTIPMAEWQPWHADVVQVGPCSTFLTRLAS